MVQKFFQRIFFDLNYQLYSLAAKVYDLIIEIAELKIMDDADVRTFANGLAVVLGVIVFFVIAVALLQYLVDPDKIEDKKQGGSALITSVIVTLLLLSFYSYGFRLLRGIQSAILEDNIIFKIFSSSSSSGINNEGTSAGTEITNTLFFNFLYCEGQGPKGAPQTGQASINNSCVENIEKAKNGDWSGIFDDMDNNTKLQKLGYVFLWFLQLIFGVVALLFFITTAIDVGVRSFKLIVLELIAVIPIACYITPKTREKFTAWLKSLGTTYADLFIRIAILGIISFLCKSQIWKSLENMNFAMKILVIIAMLTFMKVAPNFICKSLGIDAGDFKGFTINPFQKLAETPILGSAVSAVGTMAGMALGGAKFSKVLEAGGSAWRKNGGFMADGKEKPRLPFSPSSIIDTARSTRKESEDKTKAKELYNAQMEYYNSRNSRGGDTSGGDAPNRGSPDKDIPSGYHMTNSGILASNSPPISNRRDTEGPSFTPGSDVDTSSDDYRRARDEYNEAKDKYGEYDDKTKSKKETLDKFKVKESTTEIPNIVD